MNTSILDTITAAFVGALQAGTAALAAFSLPLLGVFAIIAFYVQVGPLVASGGVQVGDAVASLLLTAVKTGVFYWLLVNLSPLADAAFQTFLQWGVAPSGGVSGATFLAPSKVLDVGFVLATPIRDYTDRLIHWAAVWNWPTLLTYTLTYYLILVSFGFIALHLMMTIIEYHLAVLAGAVLIPWGVLQPTAFFAEFSLGWLTGGLVRVLVTGAIVGIAVPLFSLVKVATTSGSDPTFYSALVVAITSGIFAILSWVIPGRAAAIAGRGVSLALHGGTIVAGAAGGLRGVLAVTSAVRGISSLMRRP
jgi:type IV secretion system protein TrbL